MRPPCRRRAASPRASELPGRPARAGAPGRSLRRSAPPANARKDCPMSSERNRIELYDATLRDGMGGGGLSLTAEEKLRVVHALDALGVTLIEAGFPASNPKEQQLFELLAGERLQSAELVAFGMTRRRDCAADADEGLRVLASCAVPACTLVGKASLLHVEKIVRVTREENLRMIADLQLKMGQQVLAPEQLARLTETAHFIDELLNRAPNPAQPYVGKHAFAHKAGLHAAGVRADAQAFEHVDPAVVGNSRDVLISELSGRGTIAEKAAAAGIKLESGAAGEEFVGRVLERVKDLEHRGFQFEAADGSFELLMRKEAGSYEPLFRLESWRVLVEKRVDGKVAT